MPLVRIADRSAVFPGIVDCSALILTAPSAPPTLRDDVPAGFLFVLLACVAAAECLCRVEKPDV